jgi:hypothetical protein
MLTTTVLANWDARYTGANEVRQEARCYDFRPASFNTGSDELHLNSFVPPTSRASTPPPDKITAMKSCIIIGFVRLTVFLSRV